ncbi:MAG: energy transducer TonB [Verrucomicrobiae bacterium]|nr:energy transducer TonB [Verrucomicrobiae bacterium]
MKAGCVSGIKGMRAAGRFFQKRSWGISFGFACALHAVLFFGMNRALSQAAQYGVQSGGNNLEVELAAAPAAANQPEAGESIPAMDKRSPPKPIEAEKEAVLSAADDHPVEEAAGGEARKRSDVCSRPNPPAARQTAISSKTDVTGDGSSPVPGRDATTLRSSGGAQTLARPDYLRNPAPRYPEAARQRRQEGVVRLHVDVDERGHAADVRLFSSSGFPLLDESALRTVRDWKFQPARIGAMAIASQVEIPIRFQLR